MDKTACIAALSALGHDTRLDVFRLLVRAGIDGLPAGEIGQRLSVRQNTMSAHLAILHQAGLVRNRREGRSIRYVADVGGIGSLLGFLLEDCCGGRPELCRPVIDQIARVT
jgi:ArsR family transcriptional regulator, arsenate/arsenite/antimonite-responsive transcriptional repressor